MKTCLARKLIELSLQMVTILQDIAGVREISVTRERELLFEKVVEVLGTILSTLGVTRVPGIADL